MHFDIGISVVGDGTISIEADDEETARKRVMAVADSFELDAPFTLNCDFVDVNLQVHIEGVETE